MTCGECNTLHYPKRSHGFCGLLTSQTIPTTREAAEAQQNAHVRVSKVFPGSECSFTLRSQLTICLFLRVPFYGLFEGAGAG